MNPATEQKKGHIPHRDQSHIIIDNKRDNCYKGDPFIPLTKT